ncbi:hypothetical protein [Streptomyces syringium]|uniref:hypothetical protein n=1 Tax=Streptomyces syringium TaxID=76729 RepID=UPI0034027937
MQAQTSILPNFTLKSGTTKVCLSPATKYPSAPGAEEKCNEQPVDESAVWGLVGPGGRTLGISPTAGLYGQASNQTSGPLAMGKKRYINLHQCAYYYGPGADLYTAANDGQVGTVFDAGTNVGNTADTAKNCGSGDVNYPLNDVNSGYKSLDLLGNQFLNLHQCAYYYGAGADLYTTVNDAPVGAAFDAGTNVGNTADTAKKCGSGDANYTFSDVNSGLKSLDTADSARGRGFIEFKMSAPTETNDYTHEAKLNGTSATPASGIVRVRPNDSGWGDWWLG